MKAIIVYIKERDREREREELFGGDVAIGRLCCVISGVWLWIMGVRE